MRQIIIGGLAIVLVVGMSERASAELVGFMTNDIVQKWNSPNSSEQRRRVRSRSSSRVQRRGEEGLRPRRGSSGRIRGSLTGIASYYWQPFANGMLKGAYHKG